MASEGSSILWCVLSLVLLHAIGGGIFSLLEREAELKRYADNRRFYHQMREMYEFDGCGQNWTASMKFCEKQKKFEGVFKTYLEKSGHDMEDQEKWTFTGSVFFVTSLVSTVGYGNFHPVTPGGQGFTVLFGLLGIPIMAYTLSLIARLVVENWMPMLPLIDTKNRRMLALLIMFLLLTLSGSGLFMYLEGWNFADASYFCTCTLLSIGFGDFLPRYLVSRSCTQLYIVLGLGTAACFVAVLQIHLEVRGEYFAKQISNWYGAAWDKQKEGSKEGSKDAQSRADA